jgi:hypothetical protein
MDVRYLVPEPILMTGPNNHAGFLNMLEKLALFVIQDFRRRQKSGDVNCAGLDLPMPQKGLHRGHSF